LLGRETWSPVKLQSRAERWMVSTNCEIWKNGANNHQHSWMPVLQWCTQFAKSQDLVSLGGAVSTQPWNSSSRQACIW